MLDRLEPGCRRLVERPSFQAVVVLAILEAREAGRRRRRMERAAAAGVSGPQGAAGRPAVLEERLRALRDALDALKAELGREPGSADGRGPAGVLAETQA